MWKKTKEIARATEYMFKNKDEVQKLVLEATRDDEDQITENEYMAVAHLTADPAALSSIRKTLWKRFTRITKSPTSCRKALQILDYCVRYGSESCLQISLDGIGELQAVANSHHFSSDKPREYMNEDQCRNLVQNFLTFIKNRNAYDQARKSGQSTIQRVQSYYVEPLQVKIKPDNAAHYSGNSNSYATNTSSYGNTNQSAMSEYTQQKASYSLTPQSNQQAESSNTASNTTSDNKGIQWSSDTDSELDEDPRQASQNRSSQQNSGTYQSNQQSSTYQSQQNDFSMFNQQRQSTNTYQNQSANSFQSNSQSSANNPFNTQPQNSTQNQFQNQSNPFGSQQQQYSTYNQQQSFFTQPAQQPQQQQSSFFPQSQSPQQQSSLSQQERNFFTQSSYQSNCQPPPKQPPSADELLFGPSPSQQKQQQQQQFVTPQPDPAYNGIVDFSSTPIQPYSNKPINQNGQNGMFDEFGDLVDLNLNKQPARAHGRPEMQRGYNNNPSYQYQQKPY